MFNIIGRVKSRPIIYKKLIVMKDGNLEKLDLLNAFSIFLSCLNYDLNLKQASNDDILNEVRIQTDKYLEKIIEQNNLITKQNKEIINLLKR